MTSPYSTNFVKGNKGNVLPKGEDLIIKISGKPVFITGMLSVRKSFGRKNIIQIEQTGSRGNPEKDQITMEMKQPNGQPMDEGKYNIRTTTYFRGQGGNSWSDNFEII